MKKQTKDLISFFVFFLLEVVFIGIALLKNNAPLFLIAALIFPFFYKMFEFILLKDEPAEVRVRKYQLRKSDLIFYPFFLVIAFMFCFTLKEQYFSDSARYMKDEYREVVSAVSLLEGEEAGISDMLEDVPDNLIPYYFKCLLAGAARTYVMVFDVSHALVEYKETGEIKDTQFSLLPPGKYTGDSGQIKAYSIVFDIDVINDVVIPVTKGDRTVADNYKDAMSEICDNFAFHLVALVFTLIIGLRCLFEAVFITFRLIMLKIHKHSIFRPAMQISEKKE